MDSIDKFDGRFRRARRRCPLSRPSHVMSDDGLNDGPEPSLRQNSDDSFVSGKEKGNVL